MPVRISIISSPKSIAAEINKLRTELEATVETRAAALEDHASKAEAAITKFKALVEELHQYILSRIAAKATKLTQKHYEAEQALQSVNVQKNYALDNVRKQLAESAK